MKQIKIISVLVMVVLFAFSLVGCASVVEEPVINDVPAKSAESGPAISREAAYELVGYKYIFSLDGDVVTFKFIDAVGDSEIPVVAKALMDILPGALSFENPLPGQINIKLSSNLSAVDFDTFVEKAKVLIYDTIY